MILLKQLDCVHCRKTRGIDNKKNHLLYFVFISFFFFAVDHFWSLLNLLQYCFCSTFQCFGLRHVGSYLPDQGSNRTGDWTGALCFGRRNLNPWTTREVPKVSLYTIRWNVMFRISAYLRRPARSSDQRLTLQDHTWERSAPSARRVHGSAVMSTDVH